MRPPFAERFWAKVNKDGPVIREELGACWIWNATRNEDGYGRVWHPQQRLESAHRASWEMEHGSIPMDMRVLHACDNPPCVNPAHLFLGTQLTNVRDCIKKGRQKLPKSPTVRLTADQVHAVRSAPIEVDATALATSLGISRRDVNDIRRRRKWRLPGEREVRTGPCRGEKHARAKLSEDIVRAIRAFLSTGETTVALAKRYGVTPPLISHIRTGRIWSHVEDVPVGTVSP